jgi:hypothetical protein
VARPGPAGASRRYGEDHETVSGQGPRWLRNARYARWLAWASLGWMAAEGVVGLIAGFAAGSIALVGWALGSGIEGLASVIVVWRFTGSRMLSETAERRAQKAVAVSFWLLASYIAIEAIHDLAAHHPATATTLGIALTASSLVIMPVLGMVKRRLGERLGSGATSGEGTQNLMCAAQAAGVLLACRRRRLAGRLADQPHHRAWHRRLVGLGGKPILARRRLLLTRRNRGQASQDHVPLTCH